LRCIEDRPEFAKEVSDDLVATQIDDQKCLLQAWGIRKGCLRQ
jgi:hypothetical protein